MSISQKFIIWTIAMLTAIAGSTAFIYYKAELSDEMDNCQDLGHIVGPLVERDLTSYMMKKDPAVLRKTLSDLTSIKHLANIRILDRNSVVRFATDKRMEGGIISLDEGSHIESNPNAGHNMVQTGTHIFRWMQPIANGPRCHGCHDPSSKYNGTVVIDFDISGSADRIKTNIYRGMLIFIPAIVVMAAVMVILSRTLIVSRLKEMTEKLRLFKEGDYKTVIPVEGGDEINVLEKSFNEMAGMIYSRDREKDRLIHEISRISREWQETFDNITDPVSIIDMDFRIIRCNRAFTVNFGAAPDDIIDRKCYEMIHGASGPIENCPHKETIRTLKPVTENVLDTRTGRTTRISTFPYYSAENRLSGSVHICRDITDEINSERRLMISERLASLGRMASGIAHEINNPLASIAGCVEGLSLRTSQGRFEASFFNNYLEIIKEEIIRCRNITSAMLSFVREKPADKCSLQIHDLLDNTLEVISYQGRLTNVKIRRHYHDRLPVITGDDSELRQVFLSIISNALDSMDDSGMITIETGVEGEGLFVKISDTGAGISTDYAERIFDPFFTTRLDKGHVGLGLSIAQKVIANLNGRIEFSANDGSGTTFTISLPLSDGGLQLRH